MQVAHLVFFLLLLFDDKFLEYKFILNKSNKKMYGFAKFIKFLLRCKEQVFSEVAVRSLDSAVASELNI